jgi:hypothetical protein
MTKKKVDPLLGVTVYFVAPADSPRDQFSAGYDGNFFGSEAAAEAAIPGLAGATETAPEDWVVSSRKVRSDEVNDWRLWLMAVNR